MFQSLHRSALAIALLLGGASGAARADLVVIPAAFANSEGNSNASYPFGTVITGNYPYRYEQVYASTGFGNPGDVITIHSVSFRVDGVNGGRDPVNIEHLQLTFGTTSKAPDTLASLETGTNIDGGDATLVFDGSLAWTPCDAVTCPQPIFDLTIDFTTPFVYDPTAGNLLMSVTNLSTSYSINLFDFANSMGDEVSHRREMLNRFDTSQHLFPVDNQTIGLVTQFEYTVPEPASALAGGVALAAIAALRRSRAAR